jgi:hypothetical protein
MFDWLLRALGFRTHDQAPNPITVAMNERLCAELADEMSRVQDLNRRLEAQRMKSDRAMILVKNFQSNFNMATSSLQNLEKK